MFLTLKNSIFVLINKLCMRAITFFQAYSPKMTKKETDDLYEFYQQKFHAGLLVDQDEKTKTNSIIAGILKIFSSRFKTESTKVFEGIQYNSETDTYSINGIMERDGEELLATVDIKLLPDTDSNLETFIQICDVSGLTLKFTEAVAKKYFKSIKSEKTLL